ncbi:AraC family transcriptional regulator [Marinomonas sp. 15G1-11]|uniref:AraC family transcriptional regulator n=1 Tax=Marinomonas phaeophyticola TaxID=3004091 RepID=A0ABT4JTB5_9GAMM|nr:AraC family transcriptional regulator [Marinomonas sp. 15G1-11]MCZ2721645.1 AraC family transcriptional regulator [Marinomonas sp. 15G1-11]
MDRLSAVLNRFRPKIKRVQHVDFLELDTSISLDPQNAYLVQLCSAHVRVENVKVLTPLGASENSAEHAVDEEYFSEGSLLWIASGETLTLKGQNVSLVLCEYEFGHVDLNPFLDTGSRILALRGEDDISSSLMPIFSVLITELDHKRCGYQVVSERLAEAMLVQFLRLLMQQKRLDFGVLSALSDNKLARALVAIHDRPDKHWSVDLLSLTAGMSRSAFNRLFREKVGHTPMEYLTLWRMRLACQELQRGAKTADLSIQLGYQSETAFRRAFRKVVGQSPGEIQRGALASWTMPIIRNKHDKFPI